MLYTTPPKDFTSQFEVVGCVMEQENKLLVLKRPPQKRQGGKWGFPGGKVDAGESITQAVIREVREETSLTIPEHNLTFISTWFVAHPEHQFTYHFFKISLPTEPIVTLDPSEHEEYRWVTHSELQKLPCVDDLLECMKAY